MAPGHVRERRRQACRPSACGARRGFAFRTEMIRAPSTLRKGYFLVYFPIASTGAEAMMRRGDVLQGTMDLLILKALSLEPMHGWGITDRIRRMSRDAFQIGQGSLYPALHRSERRGWVTSYWRTTENNRIARYYDLTAVGRRALGGEIARWGLYASAVDLVIDARRGTRSGSPGFSSGSS